MERNINSLVGYHMEATDGEVGKVADFYFDDETWTIRYMIVDTGGWLHQRKVLISTFCLSKPDIKDGLFPINLTQENVRSSPDIDTAKPVSRQQEAMLNKHHFLDNYWSSGAYGGGLGISNKLPQRIKDIDRDPNEDIHLRSTAQVSGYAIHALDGVVGHVNDFIVDAETWKLTHIVVDTHNWIGGKKVLVDVEQIHAISFLNWQVFVNLKIADLENSTLYKKAEYNKDVE